MKNFNDIRRELKEEDIILYTRLELGAKLTAYRDREGFSQRELSEKNKCCSENDFKN